MPAPGAMTTTLQTLYDELPTIDSVPLQKRREMRSAITGFARTCGLPASAIIADPAHIRALTAKAPWQLAGYSQKGWANLRSRLGAALEQAGVKVHRQRRNFKLSEPWEAFVAGLSRRDHDDLHRFAGWCTTLGIGPAEVTAAVFDQFLRFMEAQSLQKNPRERVHVARRAWNRVVAGGSYSAIPAPPSAVQRGLAWDDFSSALHEHVVQWREWATTGDPFADERKPIKPVTVTNYECRLRMMLTSAVASGIEPEHFTSLERVVAPSLVKRALQFTIGNRQPDDRDRQKLHGMVVAALNVARFLGLGEEVRAALAGLERKIRFVARGMNSKNKLRLGVLSQAKAQAALLRLPLKVADELAKVKELKTRHAQRMQLAVLLDILLHLPMRIRNAAELDLASTILPPLGGTAGRWRIAIPGDEVKNKVAIDAVLGVETSALLDAYLHRYRPLLGATGDTRLFVGQSGNGKCSAALSKQLARFVQRETGLVVHAHLMRHFAALLYLKARPGDYETVRRLLGHKNIHTTITFYAGMSGEQAIASYDDMIDRLRTTGEGDLL